MRSIEKTYTHDEIQDLKKGFKIKKLETLLFLIRSKYNPSRYSKYDVNAVHWEVKYVKSLAKNKPFKLGNYSSKLNIYSYLVNYIIENVKINIINELNSQHIETVIQNQLIYISKIVNQIKYDVELTKQEIITSKLKKPFFTNILIYSSINLILTEFKFIFRYILNNTDLKTNGYWKNADVSTFTQILKNRDLMTYEYNQPQFPELFGDEKYQTYLNNTSEQDLNYNTIYKPFANKQIHLEPLFDFNLNKRELILLVILLYELNILKFPKQKGKTKNILKFEYKKEYKNNDVLVDREIIFFIENFCTINGKNIKDIKNTLNIIRTDFDKLYQSFNKLIKKLKSFKGYKIDKRILPDNFKVELEEYYIIQKRFREKNILFNFNAKISSLTCLILGIFDNENIVNSNKYNILNVHYFFENYCSTSNEHKFLSYVREIRHSQNDYFKLYQFGMKKLDEFHKSITEVINNSERDKLLNKKKYKYRIIGFAE